MAAITGEESELPGMTPAEPEFSVGEPDRRVPVSRIPTIFPWLAGLSLVVISLLVCLLAWEPGMEYPTTVSTSELPTSGGSTITITKSVRDVTGNGIDDAVSWVTREGSWLFHGLSVGVTHALINIERGLKWLPWPVIVVGLAIASFAVGRWPLLVFTPLALLFIGFMDLWPNMIDTIALMVVAVALSVAVGFPMGVLGARNRLADNIMRPILDGMQTMPSFVYLLPGILFFGLGKPAGIFATIIYAVPPIIRLTNLGIRQVAPETVEAARAFGASPVQLLVKVQVPMALPTIMAGVNQTTMMALAMVTIASMVAAGGLGDNVLRALQKNEPGNGAIAGVSIVFLAIVIDRLTQAVARSRQAALSAQ